MWITIIKYLVEAGMLVISVLPVIAPNRFQYLEKRTSKLCVLLSALVLVFSICDDIVSAYETRQLQKRVEAAEHALAPRTVSKEQAKQILKALRAQPNGLVYVVSRMMDGEGNDYADQLAQVLANAWRVVRSPETGNLTENVTGLGVCSYKSRDKLPGHDALRECLLVAGIPCKDIMIRENTVPVPDGPGLLLVVGRKN